MRHDREADTTLLNELERSSSLLRATLESTADGILVVDLEGRIVLHNRRFAELWRLPDEILQSRNDEAAISWVLEQLKDPDAFLVKVRELYASPDASSYDVLEFKDGRVFERYSQPQVIDGKSAGRVWSFRDVTERRLLQNQLSMSQKMEAVGRLAGGVAHDFNNLLTAIVGHAELLKDQLKDSQAIADVEEIERAAERATSLTRQLLAFSRRQVLQPVVLDINETVEGVRRMFERVIGEHIKLEFQLAAKGMVRADPAQLDQVLINLALNARDAMPRGGTLGVDTSDCVLDAEYVSRHAGSREGPHVRLTVWDTGFGMEQQVIERIFEPFFTTRPNGTGLGLSTVYGIVKQSGGHIAVLSEPGRGSRFTIHLPRVDGEPAPPRRIPGGETARPGTETILLVEDEEIVRELAAKVLRQLGYTVLAAGGGPAAFELLAKHPGNVSLLLADVVMPDMSGPAVAERLLKERPGIKVLYMSGYADESMVEQGMLSRGAPFLPKPFTPAVLAAKVRAVLDEPGPGT